MKNQTSLQPQKTYVFYKDKTLTVTSRLGRLLHVEKKRGSRYAAIDLDTLRDGDWWMPEQIVESIHQLLAEYDISPAKYQLGQRSLVAWKIPVQAVDQIADRLAEIVSPCRGDAQAL
jgi:hypothetical protein